MCPFGMTQSVGIAFRVGLFQSDFAYAYCVQEGIQTIQMGFFETWVLHLGLFFHFNLKYPNLYLTLSTRILGFCCNTYTRTYLYKLEFWGIIVILALVLTFTNWDFGAQLQYLHLTLILSLSCVFAFHTFCAYYLETIITFVPYQTSGVC